MAIDSLGHGLARRTTPEELTTPLESALGALESTVRELVAEFGPALGIGHSMGGGLLSRLATIDPRLFAGLIAEDPAWLSPDQHAAYLANIPDSLTYHNEVRKNPSATLAANELEYPSWPDAERAGWLAGKIQVDLDLLASGDVGYVDWREWVSTLRVPTLVITGGGADVILGAAGLNDVDALANPLIETKLMEQSRHCVRRENPDRFQEVVDEFAARIHPAWQPERAVLKPGETPVPGPHPSPTASFYVDPELHDMLDAPYYPQWDVAGTRERHLASLSDELPSTSARLEVYEVAGREMRVWIPPAATRTILAIHGGGFTAGSARGDDAQNAELAEIFEAVVVSPDYELAPERPFPAGAVDCVAAAEWAAREWDLPLTIYGDSAGGGIAETVAAILLDRSGPSAEELIMIEPFLDPSQSGASQRTHAGAQMWNRNKAFHAWQAYLGNRSARVLPRLVDYADSPAKPRVFTAVASADLLRDEGIRWTTELVDAGFEAQLHMMAGTFHSGLSVAGSQVWLQLRGLIEQFLARRP